MSNAATPWPGAPDPLGRRRCPNCLYDRAMLAADHPCPECGYVVPPGVEVFTFARAPVGRRGAVIIAVALAVLLVFPTGPTWGADWPLIVGLAPVAVLLALRALRPAWSDEAYTVQLWLAPGGIGIERDADRDSPLRAMEVWARLAAALAPVFVGLADSVGVPRHAIWMYGSLTTIVIAVFLIVVTARRRACVPRIDVVAPPIFAWHRLRSVEVKARGGGQAWVELKLTGLWATPIAAGFEGDSDVVDKIRVAIRDARPAATGVT